jgi:glycosyltransferase involved in cell wall biosynthesis
METWVAVLLATRNGERFLAEQLDSILAQTFSRWKLWASDDGSRDSTISLLDRYCAKNPEKFSFKFGPERGFVANFLSLVCDRGIMADYYAFCDQDDIWEPEKLARAVKLLQTVPSTEPALYCSRARLVDETGQEIGLSPLFSKPPSFANALVQNIGGGNTMVFNHAARQLLLEAGSNVGAVSHDWWTYQVVSGCGGRIFYDSWPSLHYRQHNDNLVGCNIGWNAKFARLKLLWRGRFKEWNNRNLEALRAIDHLLAPDNQMLLGSWAELRHMPLRFRLTEFLRSGIYRQTLSGNLGLFFAILCCRI